MPVWGWIIVGAIGVVALGMGAVLVLAYTFTKGDNPDADWPL